MENPIFLQYFSLRQCINVKWKDGIFELDKKHLLYFCANNIFTFGKRKGSVVYKFNMLVNWMLAGTETP